MKTFRLQFETQSDFQYLPFLTRIFGALKIPNAHPLTQILVEAYNNAVIHGHRRNSGKWVGIDLTISKKRICIRLLDRGPGFSIKNLGAAKKWGTTGRGMHLIQAHASQISSYYKNGLHVFEAICHYA